MIDKDSFTFSVFNRGDPAPMFVLLKLAKLAVFLVDIALDILFGTTIVHGSRKERMEARASYERSAQLVDVLARGAWSYTPRHDLSNFLYRHRAYVSPSVALTMDNATLAFVTKTETIFCVTEPGVSAYNTTSVPFAFMNHFFLAGQLLIVDHGSFHRLAEEAGDPKERVVIIGNTARSGSTLICQMFARLPRVRVLCEPWALTYIHGFYSCGEIDYEAFTRLARSAVRLLLKTTTAATITAVLKLPLQSSPQIPTIKELFPQISCVFNTRTVRPSLASRRRMIMGMPFLYRRAGMQARLFFDHLPLPYDDQKGREFVKDHYSIFGY